MKRYAILLGIILIAAFPSAAAVEAWKLHPAFDDNPVRIIDTASDTWFVVHQQYFDRTSERFGSPSLTIFRYEKSAPEKGIQPLCRSVDVYSPVIRRADYFPEQDLLAIGYPDGMIELLYGDGRIARIDRLTKSDYPGITNINSFMCAGGSQRLLAATDCGFLEIDAASGAPGDLHFSSRPLSAVFDVEGRLVALTLDGLMSGDSDAKPDALQPIAGGASALAMIPLDGGMFAFIDGTPGSNNALMLAEPEGEGWRLSELCRDYFSSRAPSQAVTGCYEGNLTANRDGVFLFSPWRVWQLSYGSGKRPEVTQVQLDVDMSVAGSWDFAEFWGYRDRGMFVRRARSASGWHDLGEPLRPAAPITYLSNYMASSPHYGLLIMNREPYTMTSDYSRRRPMLLSGLQKDKWNIHSPVYTRPRWITVNPSVADRYAGAKSWFPQADPAGVTPDPLFPDYIWSGSIWGGVMMTSLADMGASHRRFGAVNDYFADFPGFHGIVPDQEWDTFSAMSAVSADRDGNLWTAFFNHLGQRHGGSTASLLFFTADDRRQMMQTEPSTGEKGETWQEIALPYYNAHVFYDRVLALRHESHPTTVVAYICTYDGSLIFLDHKGTLKNTADDRIVEVKRFLYPEGFDTRVSSVYDIVENPRTGDLFLSTENGCVVIRRGTHPEGDAIRVERPMIPSAGKDPFPSLSGVNKIAFDPEGGIWIATNESGVVGLTPDMKNVKARYHTGNSPLPSDEVYSLAWNESANSLMISTAAGLAEVTPRSGATIGSTKVEAVPRSIVPGYNGSVKLLNVPFGASVRVEDSEGNAVAELPRGSLPVVEWNLCDRNGARVSPGVYMLIVSDGSAVRLPVLE